MVWIVSFYYFHYLIKGYNFIEKLESSLKIERPHFGELLYEKESFVNLKI